MRLVVRLPFPDPRLSPNRKNGRAWQASAKIKAGQYADAYYATKQAAGAAHAPFFPGDGAIALSLLFATPDKQRRDLDNLLSASKSALDGMAKALGVDDSRFRPILVDWVDGKKPGALIAAVGVTIVSSVEVGG